MSKQTVTKASGFKQRKIYHSFQELNTDFTIKQLKEKLWAYIMENNPELMYELQEKYSVDDYLDGKVSAVMPAALKLTLEGHSSHAAQELCMNQLTEDLKPSRYHYILSVLSEEFESQHFKLKETGPLSYEAASLVNYCQPTFSSFGFSANNEDDKQLYLAITGMIAEYFEHK